MFFAGCKISVKWARFVCLAACFALVWSATPVHFKFDNANAQGGGSRRQLPPHYNLPNINALLAEGRKLNRPPLPRPPLKPSTICGHRDRACKVKKEKEKRVSQNVSPSNNNSQKPFDIAQKNSRNWFGRLGRVFSNVFPGFSSLTTTGSSFFAADSNRFAGSFNNAVAAAPAVQPPPFSSLAQAKLDPRYRIGGAGEDLFSGNYNFSLPLVSLPGRAGLDLNITLSYNSLVWIKYGGTISYDYDYYPSLTPGFRIGFPEIEGPYSINYVNTYIVNLPSGRRVEMRQTSTNRFEAVDSSYLYLTINSVDPTQMTLYSTDGTQFKFELPNGNYPSRCTQIKDRNGNYISIAYKNIGDPEYPLTVIDKVIDTLGREIFFNYDGNLHLLSITQNWNGQTFTWAQFDYDTKYVTPTFGSLFVDGPNNTYIPTISRVITGDGARHTFVYNSWGQAGDIWTYGEADNPRAAMDYVIPAPNAASPHTDCPRFTQRNDYIVNWAGATGNGWVSTQFSFDQYETYGQATGPDGVTHKEFFSTTGGTRGLTTRTETHYGGAIQQFTDITWASDSTTSPPLRPRVTETKVCDDRNHNGAYNSGTDKLRKITIEYTTIGSTIKLPWVVREYNEGGASVYRSTRTEYLASSNYINNSTVGTRRLVGLPSFTYLYEGDQTKLVAQTEYLYDSADAEAHSSAPRQHDADYSTSFRYRGNLTKALRYSVNEQGVASSPTDTETGYHITGTVAWTRDGEDHQTTISYDDSFLHYTEPPLGTLSVVTVTKSPATFAYPTKVTIDETPVDLHSTVSYNYDFGAVTRTVDPKAYAVGGDPPQTMSVSAYDSKGRLDKSLVWKDGSKYAHTRYVYGTDHNWVQTWTTVNSLSEETSVLHLLDGVSRERVVVNEHPGSQGELSAYYRVFDKMGRVVETSRPTEISSATWAPTGDDATYVYSSQEYDWKGRPTTYYHPQDPNDPGRPRDTRRVIYDGCGCAGSDVTEFLSEEVPYGGTTKRRSQKVYRDVFGRETKTEILEWEQGSVYATRINTYNVRDQITGINEQGAAGSPQITTLNYDGYGRLQTRWLPIYLGTPQSATPYDSYEYYNNDLLKKVTDPRQASATYSYNGRGLVTGIAYNVTSGVAATSNVSFDYDEAGNRVSMVDGVGHINYHYDNLLRLDWEKRHFNGLTPDYYLHYQYNLTGQVKQVKDPFNDIIDYNLDKAGQVISVTGSDYAGVTNYTSLQTNSLIKYRAWGAPKQVSYNNGLKTSLAYDERQRITSYEVANSSAVARVEHQYYADNHMRYSKDVFDARFDRAFQHDHVDRVNEAYSGLEARTFANRPRPDNNDAQGPYRQSFQYDAWSRPTAGSGRFWSQNNVGSSSSYEPGSGRRQYWGYDVAGNVLSSNGLDAGASYEYDARSLNTRVTAWEVVNDNTRGQWTTHSYDGDGQAVKRSVQKFAPGTTYVPRVTYYLYATALGGALLTELDGQGAKQSTHVRAAGLKLAEQRQVIQTTTNRWVYWQHRDPVTGSSGFSPADGSYAAEVELDGLGANVGRSEPVTPPPTPSGSSFLASRLQYRGQGSCQVDGIAVDCYIALTLVESGAAVVAPGETTRYNRGRWEYFKAYADGTQGWATGGYVPGGSRAGGGLVVKAEGKIISVIPNGPYESFQATTAPLMLRSGGGFGMRWQQGGGPVPLQDIPPFPLIVPNDLRPHPCSDAGVNTRLSDSGRGFYTYVGSGGRRLEYGQPGVISNLTRLAGTWSVDFPNNLIGIGDIGERGGAGNFNRHPGSGHAGGVIVDIRPMRNDGASGQDARTSIGDRTFDRELTSNLLQRIQALPGFDSVIFGNSRNRFPGAQTDSSGAHNNHMHVVFRDRAGCKDYDLTRALSAVGWGILR